MSNWKYLSKSTLFKIIALLLGFALLIIAELAIRFIKPSFLENSLEENVTPAGQPYFEIQDSISYKIFRPSIYYKLYNHSFEFIVPKPKGVTRIFTLGDSTVKGHPFFIPGAFTQWLNLMLSASAVNSKYEVINSGQGSYPAYETLNLEKQIFQAQPDIFILYVGNNEFFYWRDRSFKLSLPYFALKIRHLSNHIKLFSLMHYIMEKVSLKSKPKFELNPESMLKHAVYFNLNGLQDNWDFLNRQEVLLNYKDNLKQIVMDAISRQVKVVLCTIPVNLRNWEPYSSYHNHEISQATLEEFNKLVAAGQKAYSQNDYLKAAELFTQAKKLDDWPAELNYYLGHTLLKLGDNANALICFQKAVDNDPFRDRSGSDINQIIRQVAHDYNVPLADIEMVFREKAEYGIPGDDLFVDFVHPTLEGQKTIAETVFKVMLENGMVEVSSDSHQKIQIAFENYERKMPAEWLYGSYYTAASTCAFMGRFSHALKWINQALTYMPDNPEGLYLKNCLEQILKDYDASKPWGEVKFALNQP